MQVILAASGGGSWGTMTEDCRQALKNASCIIGARRLIEGLSETYTPKPCGSYPTRGNP